MFLLISPTEPGDPKTFRKINMKRVFMCGPCQKCWMGNQLWKRDDGKYVCQHCNNEVSDVTDSPLGQSFLQVVQP